MSTHKKFEQVKSVRLYQRIVEQIEDAIARGELQPGARLPSERELVVQFGTSRPTVREALRVLESNGVVRSRPGDPNGPEILPFSPVTLQKQLTRMLNSEGLNTASLITFRMILDGCGSQLAAQLRTDAELEVMEQRIAAMADAIDAGYEAFGEADIAFHDAIAAATRNALLPVCNDVVRSVVVTLISDKVASSQNSKALMLESLEHHREVLAAIRDGDGTAASRISCRNLYDYYNGYVSAEDRPALGAMLHPDDLAERQGTTGG
ncbi:FadR/GntR family transcriptional regulator [Nocardioides sp. LHG3406-4]|uniref:FadR/GntR family transcriptional regulator n=1 Tax=Nocardioides sp. LHG3406-4 TaxID=2804575 RepID=UPI003CF4525E